MLRAPADSAVTTRARSANLSVLRSIGVGSLLRTNATNGRRFLNHLNLLNRADAARLSPSTPRRVAITSAYLAGREARYFFTCLPRGNGVGEDLGVKGGMIVPARNGGINLKVFSLSLPGAKPRAVEGMQSSAKVSVE
jgi:hypothetical protein